MFENLVKFMDSFLEMDVPGYDILIYRDGKEIFRKWGGYTDVENKIAVNGKERYNIYSCSKLITCVAAMQLWEKGLFSLDDKLSDYIPEFKEMYVKTVDGVKKAEKPILITHLFEMTAGFSYEESEPIKQAQRDTDGRCPTVETIKYLAQEPLLFEPGTRWEYSLCHDVLAAVVEVITGQRFSEYVEENIFKPLGMTESTFNLPKNELETICAQYWYDNKTKTRRRCDANIQISKFGTEYESGGAGCISTVADYMKFLEGVRTYKLLKKETVELMATNRLDDEQIKSYWPKHHGYGLGVRCKHPERDRDDFGWGGAAGAYLAIDIERKLSIYYAQHMLSSPNSLIREDLYYEIIKEMGI